jgi:hypothetical protein
MTRSNVVRFCCGAALFICFALVGRGREPAAGGQLSASELAALAGGDPAPPTDFYCQVVCDGVDHLCATGVPVQPLNSYCDYEIRYYPKVGCEFTTQGLGYKCFGVPSSVSSVCGRNWDCYVGLDENGNTQCLPKVERASYNETRTITDNCK